MVVRDDFVHLFVLVMFSHVRPHTQYQERTGLAGMRWMSKPNNAAAINACDAPWGNAGIGDLHLT
jgi:hypothetical protein